MITREIAMLIAPVIGGLIGGGIAFFSAQVGLKRSQSFKLRELALPRILEWLEELELIALKIRTNEALPDDAFDRLVMGCGWLPQIIKESGLHLATVLEADTAQEQAKIFHNLLVEYKKIFQPQE